MEKKEKIQRLIMAFFLIGLIGCIAGWIYEMIFYRINDGEFIKRGQGFGPWLPIYGFGILVLAFIAYKKPLSSVEAFFTSALGGGIIEFIVGWMLFHFANGLRLWDYNTEIWNLGNISGYVCLRSVLFFGLFGVFFNLCIIPPVFRLSQNADIKKFKSVATILGVLFWSDILLHYIILPLCKTFLL